MPAREEAALIERRASARSKTLPLNIALYDELGVEGTVAWTAGPNAALWGVIGSDICPTGDCTPYTGPLDMLVGLEDQGDCWINCEQYLTSFWRGRSRPITSTQDSKVVTVLASLTLSASAA